MREESVSVIRTPTLIHVEDQQSETLVIVSRPTHNRVHVEPLPTTSMSLDAFERLLRDALKIRSETP